MKGQAARARKSAGKRPQSARLTQMVVYDALRSWVIPTVAGVVVFVLYVLYSIELVDADVAVTVAGSLALLVLLFFGLRGFFEDRPDGRRLALLAGFAVLWCAVTFYPFYRAVNPGAPLFSAELKTQRPARHHSAARQTRPLQPVRSGPLPTGARDGRTAPPRITSPSATTAARIGCWRAPFAKNGAASASGAGRRSSLVPVMHESSIACRTTR